MSRKNASLILLFGMLLVVLVACSQENSTPLATTPAIPASSAGQVVEYVNEAHAYSLRYPDYYSVENTSAEETVFFLGSLLSVQNPRLAVKVIDYADGSLDQAVASLLAEFEGYQILGSELTVGGEPAIMLDNVPGQDLQRIVLVVKDGRLYQLTFTPLGSKSQNVQGVLESLYQLAITSFDFR